jgi:uncharacterized protein (DUF2267 family)
LNKFMMENPYRFYVTVADRQIPLLKLWPLNCTFAVAKGDDMSKASSLDRAFQVTREFLHEAAEELRWVDERRVHMAVRAVLHAIRDRLSIEEAAHFGAELPTYIRGWYYEGWRPGTRPVRNRSKEAFLGEIGDAFLKARMAKVDADFVTQAVLRFLNRKIAAGEISDVRGQLPKAVRALWPDQKKRRVA